MSFIAELWIPIVLSAVLIFIASSLVHMVFKWHNSEYGKLPDEDAVRAALNAGSPKPGLYVIPHCLDMKDMGTPEMQKKFVDGPVGFVTLRAPGPMKMGGALGGWFVYLLVVCTIAAYVARRSLPVNPDFHEVARVIAALSLLAYGAGSVQNGIWMGKPWSAVAKEVLDAIIYAAIAGTTFGLLWPH